jgi:nitrogen fixation/metabolism regulation signal transduction histidine kinase
VRTDCLPLSNDDNGPLLVATFVTSRDRIDHQAQMSETYRLYHEITSRRSDVIWMNVLYFSGIFGLTILISGWFAFNFARSVSRRVATVAEAARKAARGDLSIAVPESGADEIWELAVAFNRMLRQINRSRARIEYLQNMGAWQQMARRLAHEIKNPLTPIQLAVEETHSKYDGNDPKFRALLDTTVEIVREEIATLRRLVSEFSEFARMPKASPARESLQVILGDLKKSTDLAKHEKIVVDVEVPSQDQTLAADRQMLRRALDNVVQNAVQAITEAGRGGHIEVHTHIAEEGRILIDIDDDGPGISEDKRAAVFDPYFTTRREGTGLGLAIVKKIIVEHGGMIVCEASPLGGARFRISLPPSESEEASAALAEAKRAEKDSSRSE